MSEYGELCRDMREFKRHRRLKFGVECPQCKIVRPKTNASILLPQQKCRVDGYVDPRPRSIMDEDEK